MGNYDFKVSDANDFNDWYHNVLNNPVKIIEHQDPIYTYMPVTSGETTTMVPVFAGYNEWSESIKATGDNGLVNDDLYNITQEQMNNYNSYYATQHPDFHGTAYQIGKEPTGCCHICKEPNWKDPEISVVNHNVKEATLPITPEKASHDTVQTLSATHNDNLHVAHTDASQGVHHDVTDVNSPNVLPTNHNNISADPSQVVENAHHLSDIAIAGIGVGVGVGAIACIAAFQEIKKKLGSRETIKDPVLAVLSDKQEKKDRAQNLIDKLNSRKVKSDLATRTLS